MMVCRSEFCLVISFVFFSSHSDGLRGSGYTVNTDVSVHPCSTHIFPLSVARSFSVLGFGNPHPLHTFCLLLIMQWRNWNTIFFASKCFLMKVLLARMCSQLSLSSCDFPPDNICPDLTSVVDWALSIKYLSTRQTYQPTQPCEHTCVHVQMYCTHLG